MGELEDNSMADPGDSRAQGRRAGSSWETREKKARCDGGSKDTRRSTSWPVTEDGRTRHRWGLLASASWATKCRDLQGSQVQTVMGSFADVPQGKEQETARIVPRKTFLPRKWQSF